MPTDFPKSLPPRPSVWGDLWHAFRILVRLSYLHCRIWVRSIGLRPIYLEVIAVMAVALIAGIVLGWI